MYDSSSIWIRNCLCFALLRSQVVRPKCSYLRFSSLSSWTIWLQGRRVGKFTCNLLTMSTSLFALRTPRLKLARQVTCMEIASLMVNHTELKHQEVFLSFRHPCFSEMSHIRKLLRKQHQLFTESRQVVRLANDVYTHLN